MGSGAGGGGRVGACGCSAQDPPRPGPPRRGPPRGRGPPRQGTPRQGPRPGVMREGSGGPGERSGRVAADVWRAAHLVVAAGGARALGALGRLRGRGLGRRRPRSAWARWRARRWAHRRASPRRRRPRRPAPPQPPSRAGWAAPRRARAPAAPPRQPPRQLRTRSAPRARRRAARRPPAPRRRASRWAAAPRRAPGPRLRRQRRPSFFFVNEVWACGDLAKVKPTGDFQFVWAAAVFAVCKIKCRRVAGAPSHTNLRATPMNVRLVSDSFLFEHITLTADDAEKAELVIGRSHRATPSHRPPAGVRAAVHAQGGHEAAAQAHSEGHVDQRHLRRRPRDRARQDRRAHRCTAGRSS